MGDMIAWARLQTLSPTVSSLSWPEASYMVLERVPRRWLTEEEIANGLRLEALDPTVTWADWARGRLFCESFELRWERRDGAFDAVYVGEEAELSAFQSAADPDLANTTREWRSYQLWGNPLPDDAYETAGAEKRAGQTAFVEFTVPRLLYYPVANTERRVRLRVCEYVDPTRAVVYYRFCGLEREDVSL
jgi:hypothetical protein